MPIVVPPVHTGYRKISFEHDSNVRNGGQSLQSSFPADMQANVHQYSCCLQNLLCFQYNILLFVLSLQC